jgi:uncharacterized protein YtpQ (UPF0354 family)
MRSVLLVLLILLVAGTAIGDELLSKSQFTEEAARVMRIRRPHYEVKVSGELQIDYRKEGDTGSSSQLILDNAYKEYGNEPAHLKEILAAHLRGADDAIAEQPCKVTDIMPTVKDAGFIEAARRQALQLAAGDAKVAAANKKPDLVADVLVDQLFLAYVLDSPDSTRFITANTLQDCGVKAAELRKLALDNLRAKAEGFTLEHDSSLPGLHIVSGDNYYENALMALDDYWNAQRFPFKGQIVVATPARGLLLVVDGADTAAVDGLSRLAHRVYQERPYNLSPALFVRSGSGWIRYRD